MQNYFLKTAFFVCLFFLNVADVASYWPHMHYAVFYRKKRKMKREVAVCCLTEARTSLVHRAGDLIQK